MAAERDELVQELLQRQGTLWERLRRGIEAVRAEQLRGSERADYYFERWLSLLTDYEQTIDKLRELGVDEVLLRGPAQQRRAAIPGDVEP
jgi:hypothetical protein